MSTRRKALKTLSALPLVGGLLGSSLLTAKGTEEVILESSARDFFKELGLRTFINAAGTYTSMTGSLIAQRSNRCNKLRSY